MQRPLQEHIASLEEKIAHLKTQANHADRTAAERYQAALDLGIAERALIHFRKAYELEQRIAGRNTDWPIPPPARFDT